jgi:hypothetical protein
MAAARLALREPHSNAIGALRLLARGLAIAGEPRLALALLCSAEPVSIMLKEYQQWISFLYAICASIR